MSIAVLVCLLSVIPALPEESQQQSAQSRRAAAEHAATQVQQRLDRERQDLEHERGAYFRDVTEFERAIREDRKVYLDRIADWVKTQARSALAVSDPILFVQVLLDENLDIYRDALKGDWSKYVDRVRQTALDALGLASPVDPLILLQLTDQGKLFVRRQQARNLDERAANLLERQQRLDRAQAEMIARHRRQTSAADGAQPAGTKKAESTDEPKANTKPDSTLDEAIEHLNYLEQGDAYFDGRPDEFAKFLERHPEFKKSHEAAHRAPDEQSSSVGSSSGGLLRAETTNVPTGEDRPALKDRGSYTPLPRIEPKGATDELRTGTDEPPRTGDAGSSSGKPQELRSLGMGGITEQPSGRPSAGTSADSRQRAADTNSSNDEPRLRTRRAADPQQELLKLQREYEQYLREEGDYTSQVKGHLNDAIRQLGETVLENYAKARFGDSGESHVQNTETLIDLVKSETGRQAGEALARRVADWFASKLSGVAGLTPDLFDTLMQLLTLQQDAKQRDALDRWRESIEQRRAFWSRELQKQQADRGRSRPPGPRKPSTDAVSEGLSRAGMRVTSASEAVAQNRADIGAVARKGYSLTEVRVANLTNEWLAIDFSGSFLQPSNSSGSQRIGLVSAASNSAAALPRDTSNVLLASLVPTALPVQYLAQNRPRDQIPSRPTNATTGLYARENWVVVGPHMTGSVTFNSVCLDRSRGVPHVGEQFTMSSVPLPGRLQRLLLSAAYTGSVPQSEVWGTIARERINWFDARMGSQVQNAFARDDFESAISLARGLLDVKSDDPELIRLMGLSLYQQGLRETNYAKALGHFSESVNYLLDAVDLGLPVSLPAKHHKGFVGFENLVSANLTITRNEVKLASGSNREFVSPRRNVAASEPADKANRVSIIVSPGDARGKTKTYNVYPESCGIAKEPVNAPRGQSIELSSVRCAPISQAASEVLARVVRGK